MGRGGPPMARFMGKPEPAKDVRGTVLRLWGYLRRQRLALIVTAVVVVVNTGLALLGPYLLGVAIDDALTPGDLAELAQVGLLMLGVYALNAFFTWLQTYVMAGAAQRTVRDLRSDLFDRLQDLPLRFFDSNPHGELMSRLTNDIENINMVLSESVTQLISGVLSLVGVAAVMLWLNPRLALVTLLTTPLMIMLLTRLLVRRTRTAFRAQQIHARRAQRHHRGDDIGPACGQGLRPRGGGDRAVRHGEPILPPRRDAGADLRRLHGADHQLRQQRRAGDSRRRGRLDGRSGAGDRGHHRQLHQLQPPVRPAAQRDRQLSTTRSRAAVAGAERVFELIDEMPEHVAAARRRAAAAVRRRRASSTT